MIKIFQTIVRIDGDSKTKATIPGDCLRAGVASLFELNIIQVPHFLMFNDRWYEMLFAFNMSQGYRTIFYQTPVVKFTRKNLINDCIMASVGSRTFKTSTHLVLINSIGRVIHDPNPNKKWLDENILETNELRGWYCLTKKKV